MPQSKSDWCFVLFVLMTILIISLDELLFTVSILSLPADHARYKKHGCPGL